MDRKVYNPEELLEISFVPPEGHGMDYPSNQEEYEEFVRGLIRNRPPTMAGPWTKEWDRKKIIFLADGRRVSVTPTDVFGPVPYVLWDDDHVDDAEWQYPLLDRLPKILARQISQAECLAVRKGKL